MATTQGRKWPRNGRGKWRKLWTEACCENRAGERRKIVVCCGHASDLDPHRRLDRDFVHSISSAPQALSELA